MKRRFIFLFAVAGLIAAVFVLLLVFISPIAHKTINSQLDRLLAVEATLGGIRISPLKGRLQINDLIISQPAEDEDAYFLQLGKADIVVRILSLFRDVIEIEYISLSDISASIVRSKEGEINTAKLVLADKNESSAEQSVTGQEEERETTAAQPRPVMIRRVRINNVRLHYKDYSLGNDPLDVLVTNIVVNADELTVFGPSTKPEMKGSLAVRTDIAQKNSAPGRLSLVAALDTITTNIPAINLVFNVVNLRLQTLNPLIPVGASQVIGGDSLNIEIKASISPDFLLIKGLAVTKGMQMPLVISGTPANPDVKGSMALFSLMSRSISGGLNTVGGITDAGLEVTGTALNTGMNIAGGAGDTIGQVGKGLLGTAKGVVNLDRDAATAGLKNATIGTLGAALKTATSAGTNLVKGVMNSADIISGAAASERWDAMSHGRWAQAIEEEERELRAIPYPGLGAEAPSPSGSRGQGSQGLDE